MKIPQAVREVIDKGPLAHLTTLNPNGSPQVSVVWVGIDGEPTTLCCLLLRKSCASYLCSQLNDLRVGKVDLPRHSFGDLVAG
jgi:hypothetical protein